MTDYLKSKWQRLSASARVVVLCAVMAIGLCTLIALPRGGATELSSAQPVEAEQTILPQGHTAFFGLDSQTQISEAESNGFYVSWGDPTRIQGDSIDISHLECPAWAVAGFKTGGEWTNLQDRYCWHAPANTNSASLQMETDRTLLITSNAILEVSCSARVGDNSSLLLDLYDANETVIATNLYGNLIAGVDAPTTLYIGIPFRMFPGAVGISLRAAGEVTVFESLLFPFDDLSNNDLEAGLETQPGASVSGGNAVGNQPSMVNESRASASKVPPTEADSRARSKFVGTSKSSKGGGIKPLVLGSGAGSFSNWNCKMQMTFAGYSKSTTLTNFPALVILSTNLSGFSYSQFASTNGYDLRFSDTNQTTELNYEMEKWNTNGSSYVWVQAPAISGTNTYIWAYWGNSNNTVAPSYTTNGATWSNGFAAVWHMNQTNVLDSTANGNNGTAQGGGIAQTNGLVGQGNRFDGASWIKVSDSTSLRGMTNLTVSFWLKGALGGVPLSRRGNSGGDNPYGYIAYQAYGSTTLDNWYEGNGSWNTATLAWSDSGSWHYYCFSGSGSAASSYKDGVCQANTGFAQGPFPTLQSGHQNLCIGTDNLDPNSGGSTEKRIPSGDCMDEVRVETIGRSSNWIWACWMNMGSNASFIAYGAVTNSAGGGGGSSPAIDNDGGASNITITAATLNGNLSSTGGAPTTVYVYWGTTDGSTNQGSWANSNNLGVQATGIVSSSVTGLAANTPYYYNFYATNSNGNTWASPSSSFTTLLDTNSFLHNMKVTFPGYNKPETLTNFPALVTFSASLDGFSYSQFASSSGGDLRFTDSSQSNELKYEVEKWNTGGVSYVWVQVPALTSNASIWAYWGNSNNTVAPSYTTNGATWSQGFAAVWHMNQTNALDSTANGNNGTVGGGAITQGVGAVGSANSFNGSSCITVPDSASLKGMTNLTVSFWLKGSKGGVPFSRWISGGSSYGYGAYEASGYDTWYEGNGTWYTPAFNWTDSGQWHHYSLSGSGSSAASYKDGVQVGSASFAQGPFNFSVTLCLGADNRDHTQPLPNGCAMDEVRVESMGRSSNWIWACWLDHLSNSVFNGYGAIQGATPGPPAVDNDGGASNNVSGTSVILNGTLTSTGGAAVTSYFFYGTTDGGAAWGSWGHTNNIGGLGAGTNVPVIMTNAISGLNPGTPYYYRFYATNSAGQTWAGSAASFTTPAIPPAVDNDGGASNISGTNAILNGTLTSTGGAPVTLYFFYGTTDGGAVWGSWSHTNNIGGLGAGTNVPVVLTNAISGLTPETVYYYRFYATNSAGQAWATPATNFTTPPTTVTPPVINNGGGASNVASTTATLTGNLTSTGGAPTTVYVYWGTYTDGGSNKEAWMSSSNLGICAAGPVSCSVTGLISGLKYYYRFYAANSASDVWAGQSSSFTTPIDLQSYVQKMPISFPAYNKSETLTNFPALVTLSTNLAGFSYSQFTSANGWDLRFTDSNQVTELNYEVEKWDTSAASYIWVQVPALTSNTVIWAYWGNTAPGATSAPAVYTTNGATWSDGFAGVWHLDQIPTGATNEIMDSTANANNGTTYNNMNSGSSVTGTIVSALYFDGGQSIGFGNQISLQVSNGAIEAWIKTTTPGSGYRAILGKQNAYGMFLKSNVFMIYDWSAAADRSSGISLADSQWHHVAVAFNSGVSGGTALYIDGVNVLNTTMSVAQQNVQVEIGDASAGQYIKGTIDEARVSTRYRSANWMWASWMNQGSNSVFTSYGAVTNVNSGGSSVPDSWKLQYFGSVTNADNADPDEEGLVNLDEYRYGTDPTKADTDGDGLSDWYEVNVSHSNPLKVDTAGDGLSDGWKVRYGLDPNTWINPNTQTPSGLTYLQASQHGTNPFLADTDGDGRDDKYEVDNNSNPLVANHGNDPGGPTLTVESPNQGEVLLW